MARIFLLAWLPTAAALGLAGGTAAATFCEAADQIPCQSPDVLALSRLSENRPLADLKDLATIYTAHASATVAAGGVRVIARAMDRGGYRDAALELLREAQSGVFRSSNWVENALAKVSIAEQQAALGDPDATRYLVPGHIAWPDRMTGWDRASFIAALADGIDSLGDRRRALTVYERGLAEVMEGPFSVPGEYGDRVSGLARLWLSADRGRYRNLADDLRQRIEALIDAPQRTEGAWPATLEALDERRSKTAN
jgi:hypothetical protein